MPKIKSSKTIIINIKVVVIKYESFKLVIKTTLLSEMLFNSKRLTNRL